MTTLIIDNYDSFTHNIAQYLAMAGASPVVVPNDRSLGQLVRRRPARLVLSPGPGTVDDADGLGVSIDAIRFFAHRVPILGICLGHQAIGHYFGARVRRYRDFKHGKISSIRWQPPCPLFRGVPRRFSAMRYHSLVIDAATLPSPLRPTCHAEDDLQLMGIAHERLPIYGLQFHPESIGTPAGMRILANFLHTTQAGDHR